MTTNEITEGQSGVDSFGQAFTYEGRPALVTKCSACGDECQNLDSYSDCCDERVTTDMGIVLVKVYKD